MQSRKPCLAHPWTIRPKRNSTRTIAGIPNIQPPRRALPEVLQRKHDAPIRRPAHVAHARRLVPKARVPQEARLAPRVRPLRDGEVCGRELVEREVGPDGQLVNLGRDGRDPGGDVGRRLALELGREDRGGGVATQS